MRRCREQLFCVSVSRGKVGFVYSFHLKSQNPRMMVRTSLYYAHLQRRKLRHGEAFTRPCFRGVCSFALGHLSWPCPLPASPGSHLELSGGGLPAASNPVLGSAVGPRYLGAAAGAETRGSCRQLATSPAIQPGGARRAARPGQRLLCQPQLTAAGRRFRASGSLVTGERAHSWPEWECQVVCGI